jgi:hypothetical protein
MTLAEELAIKNDEILAAHLGRNFLIQQML